MLVALRHASLVERLVVLDVSPVNKPVRGEGVGGIVRALRELDLSRLQSRKQADHMLREKLPVSQWMGEHMIPIVLCNLFLLLRIFHLFSSFFEYYFFPKH